MRKLEYAILIDQNNHFPVADPDKFYRMMKDIHEKKGEDLKTSMEYYHLRHINLIEVFRRQGVPDNNELLAAAINMKNHFEKWLNN